MPAWLLLVFLPKNMLTHKVVHSFLYPTIYGAIYIAFLLNSIIFGEAADGAGFSDLNAMMAIFEHPNGALTGWSHYLVFDLFVGAWISRDSQERGINHFLIVPCLLFTFLFGPVGLFLYALIRLVMKTGFQLDQKNTAS
jgi:hypothetical protein